MYCGATSTIANSAENEPNDHPVDSVAECIRIGKQINAITAGERDGKSSRRVTVWKLSFWIPERIYRRENIGVNHKPMAPNCFTWHWTMAPKKSLPALLQTLMLFAIILLPKKWTGAGLCSLERQGYIEDTLFAGMVISKIKNHFSINCDVLRKMAEGLYHSASTDLYAYGKKWMHHISHDSSFGLRERYTFLSHSQHSFSITLYTDGKLINHIV